MKPICRTNRRPFRPGFLSHLRSFNGYDGPEITSSLTRHSCFIGADAGHAPTRASPRFSFDSAFSLKGPSPGLDSKKPIQALKQRQPLIT